MKTIHKPPAAKQDQRRMAVLKGAPEIVLKSCTHYYHKGACLRAHESQR
jgi:magnesium-transporting ATPase (P-type)